jgi:hypothetical protein
MHGEGRRNTSRVKAAWVCTYRTPHDAICNGWGLLRAVFDLGNSQIAHFASATEAGTTAMSGAFCPQLHDTTIRKLSHHTNNRRKVAEVLLREGLES